MKPTRNASALVSGLGIRAGQRLSDGGCAYFWSICIRHGALDELLSPVNNARVQLHQLRVVCGFSGGLCLLPNGTSDGCGLDDGHGNVVAFNRYLSSQLVGE